MPNGGVNTNYVDNFARADPNATANIETTCLTIYACEEEIKPWIPEFPTSFLILTLILTLILIISLIMLWRKGDENTPKIWYHNMVW